MEAKLYLASGSRVRLKCFYENLSPPSYACSPGGMVRPPPHKRIVAPVPGTKTRQHPRPRETSTIRNSSSSEPQSGNPVTLITQGHRSYVSKRASFSVDPETILNALMSRGAPITSESNILDAALIPRSVSSAVEKIHYYRQKAY